MRERTLPHCGESSQMVRRRRAVIRAAKSNLVERLKVGFGSPSDVPSLAQNVGRWGKSGNRLERPDLRFLATSRHWQDQTGSDVLC